MSALKERFETEAKFNDELGVHHIRVAGELLTNVDKGKLWVEYERAVVKTILGWKINYDGTDSNIQPVFHPEECESAIYKSFSQAKKVLVKELQDRTDGFRDACKSVRKARKLETLAAWVTND